MKLSQTIRKTRHALIAAGLCAACWTASGGQVMLASDAATPASTETLASNAAVVGDSLHLVVGRSMFINTVSRVRRVYVSNPAVIESLTASPYQIVVTARAPGISTVILWDESGHSRAYLVSCDVDVSGLRAALKDAFPTESIRVDGHEDQITLAGTISSSQTGDAAVKLAGLYSKSVADSMLIATRHNPQVSLKVRVVEIDRSRALQLGFNFFSAGKNTANIGTGQFPAITVAPGTTAGSGGSTPNGQVSSLLGVSSLLNLFYYNNSMGLGAAIQDLINKQIVQILAEPTLTALSGQKASFLSGGEFPFPVIQGTGGFTSVTIEFRPYGVRVDFTPVVLPDGTIQLKVAPEVSALDYTNEVTISGYTIPALSTRRAETQVELRSGQSFVISGLLDNRTTDQLEKIPGIADIPILGKLFQTKTSNHSVAELAVIVTPTLVDPLTQQVSAPEPRMVVPFIATPKFDKDMTPKNPPPTAQQQQQGASRP